MKEPRPGIEAAALQNTSTTPTPRCLQLQSSRTSAVDDTFHPQRPTPSAPAQSPPTRRRSTALDAHDPPDADASTTAHVSCRHPVCRRSRGAARAGAVAMSDRLCPKVGAQSTLHDGPVASGTVAARPRFPRGGVVAVPGRKTAGRRPCRQTWLMACRGVGWHGARRAGGAHTPSPRARCPRAHTTDGGRARRWRRIRPPKHRPSIAPRLAASLCCSPSLVAIAALAHVICIDRTGEGIKPGSTPPLPRPKVAIVVARNSPSSPTLEAAIACLDVVTAEQQRQQAGASIRSTNTPHKRVQLGRCHRSVAMAWMPGARGRRCGPPHPRRSR